MSSRITWIITAITYFALRVLNIVVAPMVYSLPFRVFMYYKGYAKFTEVLAAARAARASGQDHIYVNSDPPSPTKAPMVPKQQQSPNVVPIDKYPHLKNKKRYPKKRI